jgi:hypothetical protein
MNLTCSKIWNVEPNKIIELLEANPKVVICAKLQVTGHSLNKYIKRHDLKYIPFRKYRGKNRPKTDDEEGNNYKTSPRPKIHRELINYAASVQDVEEKNGWEKVKKRLAEVRRLETIAEIKERGIL